MKQQLSEPGDERIRCRFLLFPKLVGNERRWLERACWTEVCIKNFFFPAVRHWIPQEWVEGE